MHTFNWKRVVLFFLIFSFPLSILRAQQNAEAMAVTFIDTTSFTGTSSDSLLLFPLLDSLDKKKQHTPSDTILVNTLKLYPRIYNHSPIAAAVYYKLAGIESSHYQYEEALDLLNQALLTATKQDQANWADSVNRKLPGLYLDLQWNKEAAEQSNFLLKAGLSSTRDSALIYNSLGVSLLNQNENYKSLEAFHKVMALYQKVKDSLGMASSLNNIGVVFNNLERYDKAISYYKQAQTLYQQLNDSLKCARSFNNIGVAYLEKQLLDSAEWYFQSSLAIREAMDDSRGLTSTYNNLGILFEEKGLMEQAESFYRKSYALKKEMNDPYGLATYHLNMGFLKDKQGQYLQAIQFFKQAFAISEDYYFLDILYQASQGIAEAQASRGRFAEAYHFRSLETQYYDSLYKQNQALEIKKLERQQSLKAIKQEYEKQYALERVKTEIKQKRQERMIILLSGGFLLALIALFFFYRHKKWIDKKNQELARSNERIKESERFVLQALERTQALLDNSIVGIALITCDGIIKQVNRTLTKVSGYTESELLNEHVDIFYKDEGQRLEILNLRDAAFRNRQTFEYEGVVYSKESKPIPVHLSGRPLNFDVCEEIVWVVRDMSQLKQTQLQLNWFERFVESSNQGLAMASLDGDLVYLNPFMESLFGAMEIKKTIYNSYPASMQIKLSNEVIPTVLREGSWQGELQQQTLSGELLDTLEHFFVLKNEHGHAAYIADIITDITHLKKMEAELFNANKAKDQLFSIIGHDLRNPLGTLDSMLQLLVSNLKTMERERLQAIIENLQASASETYTLLENLLFWARGQQNKMEVTPVALNVSRIVASVENLLSSSALNKDITVSLEVPEDLYVKSDEIMTSTVIRNLATNALKFTPEGGEIHIGASEAGDTIQFFVRDSGIGIPAAEIPRLFDEHEFYSSMGTQNEAGTGIGLILCHRFVKANGGEIWVQSELDKGSTFFFTLPKA